MPAKVHLMMGTYASGTDCEADRQLNSTPDRVKRNTHGNLDDTLRLLEHGLEEGEELFTLNMPRYDQQRVNVRSRAVYAEAVRAEREDLAASAGEHKESEQGETAVRTGERGRTPRAPLPPSGHVRVTSGTRTPLRAS